MKECAAPVVLGSFVDTPPAACSGSPVSRAYWEEGLQRLLAATLLGQNDFEQGLGRIV